MSPYGNSFLMYAHTFDVIKHLHLLLCSIVNCGQRNEETLIGQLFENFSQNTFP